MTTMAMMTMMTMMTMMAMMTMMTMRRWLVLVALLGGCECNAKPRATAGSASPAVEVPTIGGTRPVRPDAPPVDVGPLVIDAPPSPAEQAFLTRRTFFKKVAREAKMAGTDCRRLGQVATDAEREGREAFAGGSAIAPERIEADRRMVDGVTKAFALARCEDNAAITRFLDQLAR